MVVAQSVEDWLDKWRVPGSRPGAGGDETWDLDPLFAHMLLG